MDKDRAEMVIRDGDGTAIVVVDRDDLSLVAAHKWHVVRGGRQDGRGYAVASIQGEAVYMHDLIAGKREGFQVDHKDRDSLNNRRSNLRHATHTEQIQNRGNWNNTTGYKGVFYTARRDRYRAQIVIDGKRKDIGQGFLTAEDAARAYDRVAREVIGEFAYQNFPGEG